MASRVVVVAIIRKVPNSRRFKGKKAQTVTAEAPGLIVERVDESSWNEALQADASINKTVPEVWISRS